MIDYRLFTIFLRMTIGFCWCMSACSPNRDVSSPDATASLGISVPEGYEVEVVAGPDLVDYPMFGRLDETGRLFLFESTGNVYAKTQHAIDTPKFRINLLEDLDGDGIYDKSTIFADSIGFPQGGVFYQGSLYATSAPDLWKLTDTDGDGVADQREVLMSGWKLNVNANSLIGPFMAPDGWMYMTSAIEGFDVVSMEGVRTKGETARVWRFRPGGADLEWVAAGGMNNPVGLAFTDASEPIGTMTYFTDPRAGERDALIYWTEGGVYPKPNRNIARDQLPLTGDLLPVISKYSRVAPSGIGMYRGTSLGDDFKGNLFSAQFNTHRILRHRLIREGATFRTEDEVFFSSEDEDFHPTDVFESGDGSLLVVETGGWFIKGCPLSQMSKPELEGSIYRVRKKGIKMVEDAYGNQLNWETLDITALVKLLSDKRPFVVDRAVESLVKKGSGTVKVLAEAVTDLTSAESRVKAIFTFYRIDTPEALGQVRKGLKDPDLAVRVAAARALGMAKDQGATEDLVSMLLAEQGAAKRQAATALGQIGDSKAVLSLLEAADNESDRFVEHALIYALIKINQPELVLPGLEHNSSQVKRVALIALDQMPDAPLQPQILTNFLSSPDSLMQRVALWVAPHHPEWAPDLLSFIKEQLNKPSGKVRNRNALQSILVAFCQDPQVQEYLATSLSSPDPEQQSLVVEVMTASQIDPFPKGWMMALNREISNGLGSVKMKSEIIQLVKLRKITELSKGLDHLAANSNLPIDLRLNALEAARPHLDQWSDPHFEWLISVLKGDDELRIKQLTLHIMAKGTLSEAQLLRISMEILPQVDAFILPAILPLYQGASNQEAAAALIKAISSSPTLANFSEQQILSVFQAYPEEIKPDLDQLMVDLNIARADRLRHLNDLEQHIKEGDIERGRRLYFGKAICYTCHTIGAEGGDLGPDLTSIQRDRSVHDLLEAIVYPSVSFVREYETIEVVTKTATYRGVIKEETPEFMVLATAPASMISLPVHEIVSTRISDISMMPQGLDKLLTQGEMADLMAFILGQDQDPELDEALLR